MKKLLVALLFAVVPVGFAFVSPGCTSACEGVSDLCDQCADQHYKDGCNQAVALENADLCSIYVSTFQHVCVGIGGSGGAPPSCATGQVFCSSSSGGGAGGASAAGCVSLKTDPQNCGTCAHACGALEVCVNGGCSSNCPGGLAACCGTCVNTQQDPNNCGNCGDAACVSGAGGAGGSPAAGAVCTGTATPFCISGVCSANCNAPNQICGAACVDVSSDAANCGDCGHACNPGDLCSNGQCGSCAPGQSACNGTCVDTQKDPLNCGTCGTACTAPTDKCLNGVCATDCGSLTDCSGACVDTTSDPKNCGVCDTVCPTDQPVCATTGTAPNQVTACSTGCPAGLANCSGACVNVSTNFNNCGNCGQSCNDNSVCTADACSNGQCQHLAASICQPASKCQVGGCDPANGCFVRNLTRAEIDALCGTTPTQCCEAEAGCVAPGTPGAFCP